jgi:hypothetical protein
MRSDPLSDATVHRKPASGSTSTSTSMNASRPRPWARIRRRARNSRTGSSARPSKRASTASSALSARDAGGSPVPCSPAPPSTAGATAIRMTARIATASVSSLLAILHPLTRRPRASRLHTGVKRRRHQRCPRLEASSPLLRSDRSSERTHGPNGASPRAAATPRNGGARPLHSPMDGQAGNLEMRHASTGEVRPHGRRERSGRRERPLELLWRSPWPALGGSEGRGPRFESG